MKFCPNCRSQLGDEATFCPMCGVQLPAGAPQPQQAPAYQQAPQYAPYAPYDHTAEFDPKDISDNKVYAMLLYLLGIPGIIIALLAANSSKYVAFHLRQALKFVVTETLLTLASALLCFTFIVPIAASIMLVVLFVIKIICFFQICGGKAKEPAIIRSLSFLK